jgi:anthranilate synthase component 2
MNMNESLHILVVDNYDSFTYNLVQYLRELEAGQITTLRNDVIDLDEVDQYDLIVLSPGPGLPHDAGVMPALLQRYAQSKPILGVCLGHQAIAEAFGGDLLNLTKVYHGIATDIRVHDQEDPLFRELPETLSVGRYHSWVVNGASLPDDLSVTATDEQGRIMALRHRYLPVFGVQFHPESILTPQGKVLLKNFIDYCVHHILQPANH